MSLFISDINTSIISGGTIFSGTSTMASKIEEVALSAPGMSQINIQNGLNTYTGGTNTLPTINVSGLTINNLTVSGTSSITSVSANTIFSGGTNIENIFLSRYTLPMPFHASAGSSLTLTNQAQAEAFLGSDKIKFVDLSGFTRCRLVTQVTTASVSGNSPRFLLKATTDPSATLVSNFFTMDIGGAEISTSLSALGMIDSGWKTMALTARTSSVYVCITSLGGDGVRDPVVGSIMVYFE